MYTLPRTPFCGVRLRRRTVRLFSMVRVCESERDGPILIDPSVLCAHTARSRAPPPCQSIVKQRRRTVFHSPVPSDRSPTRSTTRSRTHTHKHIPHIYIHSIFYTTITGASFLPLGNNRQQYRRRRRCRRRGPSYAHVVLCVGRL